MSTNHASSQVLLTVRLFAAAVAFLMAIPAHAQTFTVIADVPSTPGVSNPTSNSIAIGRNGAIYATEGGGGSGELFDVTTAGVFSTVYDVSNYPGAGVILGSDGNLYGGNWNEGSSGCGVVYQVTPAGTQTILHTFSGDDGCNPQGAPVESAAGVFYGTTANGGDSNLGTIYSVTASGTFSMLHSFIGSDGSYPSEGLAIGKDGNLYGGAQSGGVNGYGVLYKMTPAGVFSVLYDLCSETNCSDGSNDFFEMTAASDGNLYGVTQTGGSASAGVMFKLSTSGTYTVLNSFPNPPGAPPNSHLIQATDGKLYGVYAGTNGENYGGIYNLTTSGTYQILYEFCSQTNCTDGAGPAMPLVQSTDGTFYSMTMNNGNPEDCACGVFYNLSMGLAAFARLQSTSGKEGAQVGIFGQGFSSSSVVKFGGTKATKVTLSGTTYLTATVPSNALTGSVSVTTGSTTLNSSQTFDVLPTAKTFTPSSGPVGTVVTITGTGLKQTSKVEFNGKTASFTVVSDTEITATVPTGATTGRIGITTKGGTTETATSFTVN